MVSHWFDAMRALQSRWCSKLATTSGGDPSKASGRSARRAAVSTGQAQEEPPESCRGSGPALGRSRVLDFEETGGLSRPAAEAEGPGPSAGCALFRRRTGKPEPAIALLRLMFDCDTR